MKIKQEILKNLPSELRDGVEGFTNAEEIRLRAGKSLCVFADGKHHTLPIKVTQKHIDLCMQKVSKSSVYAFMDEIKNGFITLDGGHRVGLCGSAVVKNGEVFNIKNISGLNFRIAREFKGCSEPLIPYIYNGDKISNTLIISPPQCGKTTLLRDIARILGQNRKVSIIDERGEIAGMCSGVPQYDVGEMTDVIELCPKSIGVEIMLRSMSPDVIITDEIAKKDIPVIKSILSSGVSVIATAHGNDAEETLKRTGLCETDIPLTVVVMKKEGKEHKIHKIYKGDEEICL